ncbi:MAG: hypothetical protein OXG15_12405 [Gammaproteobacteria bacterium]|nr:hypothetical protein [Gammaproteobacteria bacterium]
MRTFCGTVKLRNEYRSTHTTESRKNGGLRHRYSDVFKREAVSLLMNTQASAADASNEPGISVATLHL